MLIEKIRKFNWRNRFLWGWGILIMVAVVSTMFIPFIFRSEMTIRRVLISSATVATLCLVWLAIFLEDIGIPLAFLLAGLIWSIMTLFAIGLEYGAPYFFAGGCLLGGSFGGIVGGIVRKLTKRGKAISVILTIIGTIVGATIGYVVMVLFLWQVAYSY